MTTIPLEIWVNPGAWRKDVRERHPLSLSYRVAGGGAVVRQLKQKTDLHCDFKGNLNLFQAQFPQRQGTKRLQSQPMCKVPPR